MKISITVLPGDGIGPEVIAEATKVLDVVASRYGHQVDAQAFPFGSRGLEEAGDGFPEEARKACVSRPAILLGAVGHPKHDHLPPSRRPEAALLKLRRLIESFANLRPVVSTFVSPRSPFRPEVLRGVDLLIVRELTGGLYFGEPRGVSGEGPERRAINTMAYTAKEIERVARVAFESARGRRRRVISVDKANVLETSKLWREVVSETAGDFPDVEVDHMLVDRAAMELVARPATFDVLLTSNLFGDILSDEASMLAGSLGLLPSASIGGKVGLYEPVHGSAPDIAGRGLANPIGAIASLAMMLRYSFSLEAEARLVEKGITAAFAAGRVTPDLAGDDACSTGDVGDFVADYVSREA
ncbi:MAG TPA: 3-isopropylmalate dehydrogenase [Vicinamibacteria bacterium]|nr:3-isopropylmalate dehydrogenase [Vicinamibacteria bacterium]